MTKYEAGFLYMVGCCLFVCESGEAFEIYGFHDWVHVGLLCKLP